MGVFTRAHCSCYAPMCSCSISLNAAALLAQYEDWVGEVKRALPEDVLMRVPSCPFRALAKYLATRYVPLVFVTWARRSVSKEQSGTGSC